MMAHTRLLRKTQENICVELTTIILRVFPLHRLPNGARAFITGKPTAVDMLGFVQITENTCAFLTIIISQLHLISLLAATLN